MKRKSVLRYGIAMLLFTLSLCALLMSFSTRPTQSPPLQETWNEDFAVSVPRWTYTPLKKYAKSATDSPFVKSVIFPIHAWKAFFKEDDQLDDKFLFFWTTSWESWQERNFAFLDSIFVNNPNARVYFIALHIQDNDMEARFRMYREAGYNLIGAYFRFDSFELNEFCLFPENCEWIEYIRSSSFKYAYTHLTDYLRFYLLFTGGALYSDVDVLFVREIPSGNFIGFDRDWDGKLYAAPGVMRLSPGIKWVELLLRSTFSITAYNPECFDCVGPIALNAILKKLVLQSFTNDMTLYESKAFYPERFYTAASTLLSYTNSSFLFHEFVRRRSFAYHLFGHMTRHLRIEHNSPIDIAMNQYSLFLRSKYCRLNGQHLNDPMIIIQNLTAFKSENLLFFSGCLEGYYSLPWVLKVSARTGKIGFSSDLSKSIQFTIYSIAEMNQIMSSLVYCISHGYEDNELNGFDRMQFVFSAAGKPLRSWNKNLLILGNIVYAVRLFPLEPENYKNYFDLNISVSGLSVRSLLNFKDLLNHNQHFSYKYVLLLFEHHIEPIFVSNLVKFMETSPEYSIFGPKAIPDPENLPLLDRNYKGCSLYEFAKFSFVLVRMETMLEYDLVEYLEDHTIFFQNLLKEQLKVVSCSHMIS